MGYHLPTRPKIKMQVLRGYPGNSTGNLTRTAFAKAGEALVSGMIAQIDEDGLAIVGIQDHTKPVYVCYHDATDGDAKEAGVVLFDVAGTYEFQTSFYVAGAYPEGTRLTGDAAGNVTPLTDAATEALIGFATREVAGSCVKDFTGEVSGALDLTGITFTAKWQPAPVV